MGRAREGLNDGSRWDEDKIMNNIQQIVEQALEKMNKGLPPLDSNRFDLLIELRDETQRLITAERDAEHARIQDEHKELTAQLAAKKARIDSLNELVSIRAPRSDAGKPRAKKESAHGD